ncbi:MAG: cell division protein FtsZ [Deltaproteobacteria bacterium]|nr:cell division protein FtsZ [Deltaproteobacteria bacterium]
MKFDIVERRGAASLKVVGVGGGGGNAVNTMIQSGLTGVEFIACNTDRQALDSNLAPEQVQLGQGLGAGGIPDVGRQSAEESQERIRESLNGANMVFITAGMGGGTGTGAAPIVARIARKELGALTVAIVTRPFLFEGKRRWRQAEEGIEALRAEVDTLITIPNQKLLALAGQELTMLDAFKKADEVLLNAVQSISDLVTVPGLINLDFADVRTIMRGTGVALMGTGVGTGESRAVEAANMAISSPLLENVQINGAQGVLINITGSSNMTLMEVNEAASLVQDAASDAANIIFGAVIDERMGDSVRLTVIATGFDPVAQTLGGRTHARTSRVSVISRSPRPEPEAEENRQVVNMGTVSDLEAPHFDDEQPAPRERMSFFQKGRDGPGRPPRPARDGRVRHSDVPAPLRRLRLRDAGPFFETRIDCGFLVNPLPLRLPSG